MTHEEIFTYTEKKNYKNSLRFAVIGVEHAHIFSMCKGLISAGAKLKYVFDGKESLMSAFAKRYPNTQVCFTQEEIFRKDDIDLIVSAAVPSLRADIAVKAMRAGKNFFVDKAPLISLAQLEMVRKTIKETGRKYFVYYGESIYEPSTVYALELVKRGVIGKVLHISGAAPHFLGPENRPAWFFKRENTGGIIIDIGSHQAHQFLRFAETDNARIDFARVGNITLPQYPWFDESGEFLLISKSGVTGSFYVNWKSPSGLKSWGDPRMIIQGDKGYIELRKNFDISHDRTPAHVFVATEDGIFHETVAGKAAMNYFEELISDCVKDTSFINTEIDLKAIEIAINAQNMALTRR